MGVLFELVDEGVGDATEAESAKEEGGVGFKVFDRLGGRGTDFVDFIAAGGGGEGAREEDVLWF